MSRGPRRLATVLATGVVALLAALPATAGATTYLPLGGTFTTTWNDGHGRTCSLDVFHTNKDGDAISQIRRAGGTCSNSSSLVQKRYGVATQYGCYLYDAYCEYLGWTRVRAPGNVYYTDVKLCTYKNIYCSPWRRYSPFLLP